MAITITLTEDINIERLAELQRRLDSAAEKARTYAEYADEAADSAESENSAEYADEAAYQAGRVADLTSDLIEMIVESALMARAERSLSVQWVEGRGMRYAPKFQTTGEQRS